MVYFCGKLTLITVYECLLLQTDRVCLTELQLGVLVFFFFNKLRHCSKDLIKKRDTSARMGAVNSCVIGTGVKHTRVRSSV